MLVLTRQRDQSIMIGDDIEIVVIDVRGEKVRLGINAPLHVTVHRKEVYEAIHQENRAAAALHPEDLVGGATPPHRALRPQTLAAQNLGQGGLVNAPADPFLRAAIAEAHLGLAEGGLPIGAVLVREGHIIAAGHNRRVQHGDPMAHAEIDCLTRAGRQHTYKDTILYSTLMPCLLCAGAIVQFGVPRVVVGESVNFPGAGDLLRQRGVEVVDMADPHCIEMMSTFIRQHAELWNEDTGR